MQLLNQMFVLTLLLIAAIGCEEDETAPVNLSKPQSERVKDQIHVLTLEEWVVERADKDAVLKKYGTGRVELKAPIFTIYHSVYDTAQVVTWLGFHAPEGPNPVVRCFTRDQAPWTSVTPGGVVTVRAMVQLLGGQVQLADAEIVEYEGEATPRFKTEELIHKAIHSPRYFLGDPLNRMVIVQGEIDRWGKLEYGVQKVYLKNALGVEVECHVDELDFHRIKSLKAGAPVDFLGRVSAGGKDVLVTDCTPIKF